MEVCGVKLTTKLVGRVRGKTTHTQTEKRERERERGKKRLGGGHLSAVMSQ